MPQVFIDSDGDFCLDSVQARFGTITLSSEYSHEYPKHDVTGVILSGGRARRMGGADKGLVSLAGQPMLRYVLETIRPQVARVIVNANRNLDAYREFGCDLVSDLVGGFSGPLAGMASGMQAASTAYVVSVPCDSPLITGDLVARLYRSLSEEQAEVCVVHDGERVHPVFLLLHRDLLDSILSFLESGERKIDKWFTRHRLAVCDFSDRPHAFANVNRLEDMERLEKLVRSH